MNSRFDPGGYGFDPVSRLRGATVVKALMLTCTAVYIVELIAIVQGGQNRMIDLLAMTPLTITTKHYYWQFLTAVFLHGGFLHLVFNMLGLFFFGPELEMLWGQRRFLLFFLLTGILANMAAYAVAIHYPVAVLGASGAILAILGAYGALYPNRYIILYFFPVKVKYVIIFSLILFALQSTGLESGDLASVVHLAGLVLGILYIKVRWPRVAGVAGATTGIGSRIKLWYLRRKYRHLKVMDPEDEPRWDRYKN